MIDYYLEWLSYLGNLWWNHPHGIKDAWTWDMWVERFVTQEEFPF